MKIRRLILALAACLFLACPAVAETDTLHYYFLGACESCTPEKDFAADFQQLTGQPLSSREIVYHNVFYDQGRAAYEQATAGWNEQNRQLPLLIIGDQAYSGTSSIADGLQIRFASSAADTRSVVYFLTASACGSCAKAHAVLDQHPAIVPLQINGVLTPSEVVVVEINISTEPEKAMALLRQYQVPDAQRKAPMILMGQTILAGEAAIISDFLPLLKDGAALNTPQIQPDNAAPYEKSLSLLGAALAGVTAGLNPCALSMLLVMMGMLLSLKKNIVLYGALYLSGKLAVYLLIGFGFARLWTQYASGWLPLTMKLLVTVIGAVLIVLNLMDAFHARQESYGNIRNQLPGPFRRRLRSVIQNGMGRSGKLLCVSAVAMGMVVASGEFLCAGQLYVAVLIANAQSSALLPLVIYSAAFLLPSVAILFLVALSRRTMDASDWILKRMPLIKLITALVMAAVLLYAWFAN